MDASKLAQQRLARILNDENYGPALVRLPRNQQRYILDLIDANQGTQVRSEILRLDADRRSRETRERLERARMQVYRHMTGELSSASLGYNPSTVHKGVSMMTENERQFTLTLDVTEIQDEARNNGNIRYWPQSSDWRNPWWYH